MSRFSRFCALLSLFSVVYASDICKTTSVAQSLVDSITDISAFHGLTTNAAITAQFLALTQASATAAAGTTLGTTWGGVFVGFSNGEMYGIVGCESTVACDGFSSLWVAVNPTVFGDAFLRYYSGPNVSDSNNFFDSTAYNFLTAEWYTKATSSLWGTDNWSVNPLLADGLIGDIYSREAYGYRVALTSPTAGVVLGMRYGREPCGTCYVSTFPETVTIRQAALIMPSTNDVESVSDYHVFIDFLLPYVVNNTNSGSSFAQAGYINLIAGFFGGYSYMIKDCGLMKGGGSAQCDHDGTVRYQLWVTNPDIYGNNTRFVYQITAAGTLGAFVGLGNSPAAPTGAYAVETRGFYTAEDGWTNVNVVADVTATLNRRFVISSGTGHYSNGLSDGVHGVLGGEFIDNGEGVCGSSSASTVAGATFSLILAVAVAMFRL